MGTAPFDAALLAQVEELLKRERNYLLAAVRADRAAGVASFYGDEEEARAFEVMADNARYAADLCAVEARDLMGASTDSSV